MAKNSYIKAKIIENSKVADDVFKLKIEGRFEGKAGQFYMLRAWMNDPLLPRPFSICDIDENSITFLYLLVGKGTQMMSKLKVGDSLLALGPLGNGFKISDANENIAVVAGGIGIAPMLLLLKSLDKKVDLYLGFRSKDYFVQELSPYCKNIYLTSDDGSVGHKGNALSLFEDKNYDQIYACGPNAMLKALKSKSDPKKTQLSLENHMACGVGACLGCVCKTKTGIKRVCHEGPIFIAEEVFNA